MAESDEIIAETPSEQASDKQLASVLRQQKMRSREEQRQNRPERITRAAGGTMQTGGRVMQAGGATSEYAGKAAKYTGRGVQAGSKVVARGGEAMTRAGAELSGTGLGAIIGVPMAIVGAGMSGLGLGGQALGKGVEAGGQAAEKGGRAAKEAGQRVAKSGSDLKQQANRLGSFNPLSLRSQKADKTKGQSLAGLGAGAAAGAINLPSGVQSKISQAVHLAATPFRLGTDLALRSSWTNLIPSWGLTLLYINAHVFMRLVVGTDFFSKLGHEWTSGSLGGKLGSGATATKTTITNSRGAQSSTVSKKIMDQLEGGVGVVEVMLLLLVDALVLLALLAIMSFIIFVVGLITNPVGFIGRALNL